jgi:hypothetical protein
MSWSLFTLTSLALFAFPKSVVRMFHGHLGLAIGLSLMFLLLATVAYKILALYQFGTKRRAGGK